MSIDLKKVSHNADWTVSVASIVWLIMRHRSKNDLKFREQLDTLRRSRLAAADVVCLDDYKRAKVEGSILSVVVVDQDEDCREGLKRILTKKQVFVALAGDGMELASALENHKVDLLLIAVELPWVDGYDLCRLLKRNPQYRSVPVVLFSDVSSEDVIRAAFECGCEEFLAKPFGVDGLMSVVNRCLSQ